MSGTIGAHWRHATRHPTGTPTVARSSGLPLVVALPIALMLTGAIVAITAALVERLG
jgi:hypothetical protein